MATPNSSTSFCAAKSTGRGPNTLRVACSPSRTTRAISCPCAAGTTEKAITPAGRTAVLNSTVTLRALPCRTMAHSLDVQNAALPELSSAFRHKQSGSDRTAAADAHATRPCRSRRFLQLDNDYCQRRCCCGLARSTGVSIGGWRSSGISDTSESTRLWPGRVPAKRGDRHANVVAYGGIRMARSDCGNHLLCHGHCAGQGRMAGRSGGCAHSILFLPSAEPFGLVGRPPSRPTAGSSQSDFARCQASRLGSGRAARRGPSETCMACHHTGAPLLK
jgi:hypothetical protein